MVLLEVLTANGSDKECMKKRTLFGDLNECTMCAPHSRDMTWGYQAEICGPDRVENKKVGLVPIPVSIVTKKIRLDYNLD